MLTDFRCRKCMLLATLEALQQEQGKMAGYSDEEKAEHAGKIQVLKDALRYNVEAPLVSDDGDNDEYDFSSYSPFDYP